MHARTGLHSGRCLRSLLSPLRAGKARTTGGLSQGVAAQLFAHRGHRVADASSRRRSFLGLPVLATAGTVGLILYLHRPDLATSDAGEQPSYAHERLTRLVVSERSPNPEQQRHHSALVRRALELLRRWIAENLIESIAVGARFCRLACIFLPLVVTVPLVWVGRAGDGCGGPRAGKLLWFRLVVWSLESAGATFIKLGQWAASRTDLFPPELCSLLSSLHSDAPPHSIEVTRQTISHAFGGLPLDEIFEEFDEQPLGVGAIAQVYKAKLRSSLVASAIGDDRLAETGRGDGAAPSAAVASAKSSVNALIKGTRVAQPRVPSSYVAVKVLHPGIAKTIERDLCIMRFVARLINCIPTMEWLSFPDEVRQFGDLMRLQVDLRVEGSNLSVFRDKFKDRSSTWFPYAYEQYMSQEVLIEEFARGIPLRVFLKHGAGVYRSEIAQEGLDAFLNMLLVDNFIHSDLHPGNIMVRFHKPQHLQQVLRLRRLADSAESSLMDDETGAVLTRLEPAIDDPQRWLDSLRLIREEGYRPQIVFLDTGMVTELNAVNRQNFLELFQAVAEFDGYRAGTLMVERCRQPQAVIDPDVFALRMQNLALDLKKRTFALGNVSIGDVLSQVLSMVRTHHVRLEGDFVNVVISCLLLEGIGRDLDPDLDLFRSAIPILRRLGTETTLMHSLRQGDLAMLRVWLGIEARAILQTSVESVEQCVKYDLLSPSI